MIRVIKLVKDNPVESHADSKNADTRKSRDRPDHQRRNHLAAASVSALTPPPTRLSSPTTTPIALAVNPPWHARTALAPRRLRIILRAADDPVAC